MPGHKKETVKYNIQLHPLVIEALTGAARGTAHPTANFLAADLIQYGLEYLTSRKDEIPPGLALLRKIAMDELPAAARSKLNIPEMVARNTRDIAEIKRLLEELASPAGRKRKHP